LFGRRTSTIEQVPASGWASWIEENNGILLDVREPGEWARGMLPESVTISLSYLPASLGRLEQDRPVLVVCRSGNRSMVAAEFLTRNGYHAANLAGGLVAIGLAS
jgi:rhodanese-related sulfurtransferase